MTNKFTRKGIALGAVLSVASFGLVASPAYAVPSSLTISALAGSTADTQYGVLGSQFLVKTVAVAGTSSDDIEYYITGAVKADFADIDSAATTSLASLTQLDAAVDSGALNNTVLSANAADVAGATKDVNVDIAWTAGNYNILALDLDTTAVTASRTITITPFVDNSVNDGMPSAGEFVGNTLTITFLDPDAVTATASVNAIAAGANANTMTANVVLGSSVNMASTPDAVTATFSKDGVATASDEAGYWDPSEGAYVVTASGASSTVSATSVYGAAPKVVGAAAAGTTNLTGGTTGVITSLTNLAVAKQANYAASANSSSDVIRAGSGSVTVTSSIDGLKASNKLAGNYAGHTVSFKISEAVDGDLGAATITAGGKTLTDATTTTLDSITVTAVTDADGEAEITFSYSGLVAGDQITVDPFAYGESGVATGGNALEFTAQKSAAEYLIPVNHVGGTTMAGSAGSTDPVAAVNMGDSVSITYQIADQFGQVPVGTYRLNGTLNGGTGSQTSNPTFNSSGLATVTFVDNSTTANTRTLALDFDVKNVDGVTWDNVSGATEVAAFVYAGTLKDAGRVTLTSTTDQALASITASSLKTSTYDSRFGAAAAVPTIDTTGTQENTLSGVVYGTNGAVRPGAAVTITGDNVQFVVQDGADGTSTVHAVGSVTVVADASGRFGNVAYFSNVAGARTLTATAGSVTATVAVVFDGVSANAGATWTVDAPASATPGSTFKVTATLKDKYGNVVNSDSGDTDITYTGPGIVFGDLPTETGAAGTLSFSVLLGANDSGTASVTFSEHGADNSTTAADTNSSSTGSAGADGIGDLIDNIVSTVTIVIGTAGNTGAFSAWTSNQDDGTVKMYAKNVVGEGKVQFMVNGEEIAWVRATSTADSKLRLAGAEGAAYLVRTVELVEGQKNALEIYVDGVRVERNAYSY